MLRRSEDNVVALDVAGEIIKDKDVRWTGGETGWDDEESGVGSIN